MNIDFQVRWPTGAPGSDELDLSRRVRRQNFVKTKVKLLVAELRDHGRQMYRAAVADARFNRHRRERRNFHVAARQAFDVQAQQVLNRFK